jgi:DNA-binding NtrC family response regulator
LAEQALPPGSPSTTVGGAREAQQSALGIPPETLPDYMVKLLDLNGWNLSRSLQHCERLLLEAALDKTHGNQSQTARLLGITPRSVYTKVHKHRLHP